MSKKTPLSMRAAAGKPSMTMAIAAKAKGFKAEGKDVVSFAAGEPDFKTPAHICDAGIKAINDGMHGYLPNPGMPELRKAACNWFKADNGVDYDFTQILVSPGAKFSIYLAIQAMIDPGDEVLLPAPYWVSYPEMVALADGNTVVVQTDEENGFRLTADMLEKQITDKTKAIILTSPSNPSGAVISEEDLQEIGALMEKYGLYCISDEIYSKLVYAGNKHYSIAAVSDYCKNNTVVINGCSKAYAMTGWRIGFAAGPDTIIKAMGSIQSQSTSNACTIAQPAALAAIAGDQGCVEEMRAEFEERQKLIVDLLNDIEGVTCPVPGGAFYVLPDISRCLGKEYNGKVINTPYELCDVLLEEKLVACVPGEAFGTERHIRLSYATSRKDIEEGCRRIKEFLEQ